MTSFLVMKMDLLLRKVRLNIRLLEMRMGLTVSPEKEWWYLKELKEIQKNWIFWLEIVSGIVGLCRIKVDFYL